MDGEVRINEAMTVNLWQPEVRIISLWEPFASAIARSLKATETRSWSTSYRGWLLIHAAKRWKPDQADSEAARLLLSHHPGWVPPLGRVLAVAWLESCLPTSAAAGLFHEVAEPVDDNDRALGDWSPCRWAWRLTRVQRLPHPPRWTGRQGLSVAAPALVEVVRAQLAPGSAAATAAGCPCRDVGRDGPEPAGEAARYWSRADCPMHGTTPLVAS